MQILIIWGVGGFLLGAVQAWLIWKEAQPPIRLAGGAVLRILLVAAVFFAAAWSGALISAVAGWLTGYPLSVAALAMRKTT